MEESAAGTWMGPPIRPLSFNIYFVGYDFSVLGGWISMKLATCIHHVSGHC